MSAKTPEIFLLRTGGAPLFHPGWVSRRGKVMPERHRVDDANAAHNTAGQGGVGLGDRPLLENQPPTLAKKPLVAAYSVYGVCGKPRIPSKQPSVS